MNPTTVTAFCRAFGVKYNNLSILKKMEWKDEFDKYKLNPYHLPSPSFIQPPLWSFKEVLKKQPPKNVRIVNG